MAKCSKCFANLPEGARWCSFCGEKIEEAPPMQSTSSVPAAEPVPEQAPAASDIASDAEKTVPVSQDSAAVNAPRARWGSTGQCCSRDAEYLYTSGSGTGAGCSSCGLL